MPESFESSDFDDESDYYYVNENDPDRSLYKISPLSNNSEFFSFREVKLDEIQSLLDQELKLFASKLDLPHNIIRVILDRFKWDIDSTLKSFKLDPFKILADVNLLPQGKNIISISDSHEISLALQTSLRIASSSSEKIPITKMKPNNPTDECPVCFTNPLEDTEDPIEFSYNKIKFKNNRLYGISCGHRYCLKCWRAYITTKLNDPSIQMINFSFECMSEECYLHLPDDFIYTVLSEVDRVKYSNLLRERMIESHPNLRRCVNSDCSVIFYALNEVKARRVRCSKCQIDYCFMCGEDYHAPVDCDVLKRWLVKCKDDGGTASYIAAHTKDCPNCQVCIEKNGGCNHMQCAKCSHDFCWICLLPWKTHQVQFYVCSKYPEEKGEDDGKQTRESLQRYLFYYQRWENHDRSLRLEREQKAKIEEHISKKVKNKEGTWIDWQYLLSASNTLAKCRHTLKYTYPYAYYPNSSFRLELFEYQQALLEAEVEDLSWKIGHAEITDRVDLQNKIDVCEKHRLTLLDQFLKT